MAVDPVTPLSPLSPEELSRMSDAELASALAEWKRWRNHVWLASEVRNRQERHEQACAVIELIEAEMWLRSPSISERSLREAEAAVRAAATGREVSLSAYRAARRDLERSRRRQSRQFTG